MNSPILHLLGLAKRAGKLEIGEEPVGALARSRHSKLIIVAENASDNTLRRATHFAEQGNSPYVTIPHSKEEIGMILGRQSVAMLAVADAGFAGAIGDKLVQLDPERFGVVGQKLRTKADKTLERQREKRRHEKKLSAGKNKPWAAPPKESKKKATQPKTAENQSTFADKSISAKPMKLSSGKRLTIQKKSGGSNSAQT